MDWADCSQGGYAGRGEKQGHLSEPAQAVADHFFIYADFEALTIKVEGPELDPAKSNTQRTQHYKACSYCYILVRCYGQTEPPVEYRGSNAAEHLLKSLQEEESKIKGMLADPKAMRMTREDWLAFRTAETCHVCDKQRATLCVITATLRGNIEG